MIKSRSLNRWFGYSGGFALAAVLMVGCVSDVKKAEDNGEAKTAKVDSSGAQLLTIGGSMFSIPSPIQTAMLIEKSGADYSKGFLNDAKKVSTYATNYQKALNLGVYGADVG